MGAAAVVKQLDMLSSGNAPAGAHEWHNEG